MTEVAFGMEPRWRRGSGILNGRVAAGVADNDGIYESERRGGKRETLDMTAWSISLDNEAKSKPKRQSLYPVTRIRRQRTKYLER